MMATAGVFGVSAGKRLLLTSVDKTPNSSSSAITAKRSNRRILLNNKKQQQQQHAGSGSDSNNNHSSSSSSSSLEPWLIHGTSLLGDPPDDDDDDDDVYLVDALLLLQKSMLEKQWNLTSPAKNKIHVTCSGTTARRRRLQSRTKLAKIPSQINNSTPKQGYYVKGFVSEQLLTHAQVVHLSQKIKAGLFLEDRRLRLLLF